MRWYITVENSQLVVRGGKGNKRLPIKEYRAIRHDRDQLDAFVLRLNAPRDLRDKVAFKHAFIDDALLSDYRDYLSSRIPTAGSVTTEFAYLKDYALTYFVTELGLINPADWFAVSETKWASYLIRHKQVRAAKSKRDVVNALNHFIKWLHRKRPNEVPLVVFEPISRAKYAELEARRELADEVRKPRLVLDADLKRILDNAKGAVKAAIQLLATYGLRRNEALGFKLTDVKKGHLSVERQRITIKTVGPVKGRKPRKTPHWFGGAAKAYAWIEAVQSKPMHPRTFSDKWDDLMEELDLSYHLHDLRHTFITKAVRLYEPRDVQLAVGHKDLRITMGYLRDDRDLSDEVWKPAS